MKKKTILKSLLTVSILTLTAGNAIESFAASDSPFAEYSITADESQSNASDSYKVDAYNEIVEEFAALNEELEAAISQAQELLDCGEPAYDEKTITALSKAISAATTAEETVPDRLTADTQESSKPSSVLDSWESQTEITDNPPELPDYTEVIDSMEAAMQAYSDSIQSLKQITAPTEDFVMERLQQIDTIADIECADEENDPEGRLNQKNGYSACVYFTDSQVDPSSLFLAEDANSALEMGVKGGGSVEICDTVEEAEARDLYLAAFDGTVFTSGSHTVIGTMVIRTSSGLTASEQNDLEEQIEEVLLEVQN